MSRKKKGWSEVVAELMTVGIGGVEQLNATDDALREALSQLRRRGTSNKEFTEWCIDERRVGLDVRSSRSPKVGENRVYLASKVSNASRGVVRLPLESLGVKGGEKVNVVFADGSIIVTAVNG